VRIGELSRLSGVAPATIKYYLREGLLPPGVHTHPNQVEYTEDHVSRLRLIRALIDIGGLSVSATSDVLSALDSADVDAWESVGKAQYAVSSRRANTIIDVDTDAERIVDALLARRGWRIHSDSPARRVLIDVCAGRLAYQSCDHENGFSTATSDLTIHFLSPVVVGPARADARIVRQGGSTFVLQVEVTDVGRDNKLAAVSTIAFTVLPPRD